MTKFNSETARLAGQKSKRGKAKIDPTIHEAMEIILKDGMSRLYEKMEELDINQMLKLVQLSASYVLPKTKPQLDRWSQFYADEWPESHKTNFLKDLKYKEADTEDED